jgi:hypothetical protein
MNEPASQLNFFKNRPQMTDISALNRALIVAAEAIISPRSLSATVRTLFVACYLGATPDHGVTWSPPPTNLEMIIYCYYISLPPTQEQKI